MTKKKHIEIIDTDLEIEEDIALHEQGWRVQRVGWILIFIFIILSALGFFGQGVASKKSIQTQGASIEYEKFYRRDARMELKLQLNKIPDSLATVSFTREYIKHFRIESILPEPEGNFSDPGFVKYSFNGKENMEIVFFLVPQKAGNIQGRVHVNENELKLSHFIYL